MFSNSLFVSTQAKIIDLATDKPEADCEELVRFDPQPLRYSLFVWSIRCLV